MIVPVEIPDSIALVIRGTKESLSETLKLSLAVRLYEERKLSLGEAALLANVNKISFMEYLHKIGIATLNPDEENPLERDLENARLAANIDE